MKKERTFRGLGPLLYIFFLGCASTQGSQSDLASTLDKAPQSPDQLAVFEPKPSGQPITIGYDFTNYVLGAIVLETGPSTRTKMPPLNAFTGSRIVARDSSPLRLEGNKVLFQHFQDSHRKAIEECLESLVAIGERVDIARLPRNEQLAYWLNLHNMLVVSEITKNYPVTRPSQLKVGPEKLPLHEAPLVELRGVRLSLNDIRKGIVFRYWTDPRVIYGFFTGELASPKIKTRAWYGPTLAEDLDANAREFVNSLRGVRTASRERLVVSPLYRSARDSFFPNWPEDFKAHAKTFAKSKVRDAIKRTTRVEFGRYEARTADLTGGYSMTPMAPLAAYRPMAGAGPQFGMVELFGNGQDPGTQLALVELQEKAIRLQLRQRNKIVVIEDAPFEEKSQETIQ